MRRIRVGAALPRVLLFCLLAAVGGAYIWASLSARGPEAPPHPARGVDVPLARMAAETGSPPPVPKSKAAAADAEHGGEGAAGQEEARAAGPLPGTPTYDLPRVAAREPLRAAPDPALSEATPAGVLPTVGADGREPWRAYARPFDELDKRPRIALVIDGLGLDRAAAETAIGALPGAVTLAFLPFGERARGWIDRARAAGHEVLLSVPMEPAAYPASDPGPRTLLTALPAKANVDRLRWALGRAAGYVGVTDLMGSRFTASRTAMRPVLAEIRYRGLLYFDGRSAPGSVVSDMARELGLVWASVTAVVDEPATREAVDAQLAALERAAKSTGRAVGIGGASPVTLERVARWAQGLEPRGLALVPVSAVAQGGPTG